jgi:hypothetical protein
MRKMERCLLTLVLCFGPSVAVAQNGGCHAATSESTTGLGWLTTLVTSTRPSTLSFKNLIHITATSASQVSLVTTDSVCTAAAKARAAEMQVPYDSLPIYVYKVGNVYVADRHVGNAMDGEMGWRPMHVFDLNYNFLAIAGR